VQKVIKTVFHISLDKKVSPTQQRVLWGYFKFNSLSQAARQGSTMLMASAVVVLKHETSTLRQSHNVISIDLTLDVGDNVREVTSPAKFSSVPMSGRDATWGQHMGTVTLFYNFLFFFIFFNRATAHTREPIFVHNSSNDAIWCEEDRFGDENCAILKFKGVLP